MEIIDGNNDERMVNVIGQTRTDLNQVWLLVEYEGSLGWIAGPAGPHDDLTGVPSINAEQVSAITGHSYTTVPYTSETYHFNGEAWVSDTLTSIIDIGQ